MNSSPASDTPENPTVHKNAYRFCAPDRFRVRLHLSYDGTEYHGWQRQTHHTSVQGTIEAAVRQLFNEEFSVVVPGPTHSATGPPKHAAASAAATVEFPIPISPRMRMSALASTAAAALAEDSIRVFQITLSMSNVHLFKSGKRCFLVDSGRKGDLPALAAALAREGVRFRDLAAVILTHGHADHAGLAAEVRRRSGAVVIAGRGDRSMLESGVNEPVTPTSFTARLILILPLDPRYEPLRADPEVDGELDLAPYGLTTRSLMYPRSCAAARRAKLTPLSVLRNREKPVATYTVAGLLALVARWLRPPPFGPVVVHTPGPCVGDIGQERGEQQ